MKIIYIHGGPGLNSEPEKNILTTTGNFKFIFWNEPTVDINSARDAYSDWLFSLEDCINSQARDGKVMIMAHSFGAFALNDVLPRVSNKVHKVILVSPIFNLLTLDLNIMDLAIRLLRVAGDRVNAQILELKKSEMKSMTSSTRVEIIAQALSTDELLMNYWKNKDSAKLYNQYLEKRPVSFDSFMMVRKNIQEDQLSYQFSKSASIFYGKYDPVSSLSQNKELQLHFYPNSETFLCENSGHYPHIEETDFLFSKVDI